MKFANFLVLIVVFPGSVFSKDKGDLKDSESRPIRMTEVRTTAYTHSESDHVKYGRKNALGTRLQFDQDYTSAASDWSHLPVGTKFKIEDKDTIYVIDDYGSALVGRETVDLYFPTRRGMNNWGLRHIDIEILEFGDYEKSREILNQRKAWRHCRKMLASINSIPKLPPPGIPVQVESKPKMMLADAPNPPARSAGKPAEEPILLARADPASVPESESPEEEIATEEPQPAPAAKTTAQSPAPPMHLTRSEPPPRIVRPLSREELKHFRSAGLSHGAHSVEPVAFRKRAVVPIAPRDA